MPMMTCLKMLDAKASLDEKIRKIYLGKVTAVMAHIFDDFEHFFTLDKFHDNVDSFIDIINVKFIDFNNIFVIKLSMIFKLFDILTKWHEFLFQKKVLLISISLYPLYI